MSATNFLAMHLRVLELKTTIQPHGDAKDKF